MVSTNISDVYLSPPLTDLHEGFRKVREEIEENGATRIKVLDKKTLDNGFKITTVLTALALLVSLVAFVSLHATGISVAAGAGALILAAVSYQLRQASAEKEAISDAIIKAFGDAGDQYLRKGISKYATPTSTSEVELADRRRSHGLPEPQPHRRLKV